MEYRDCSKCVSTAPTQNHTRRVRNGNKKRQAGVFCIKIYKKIWHWCAITIPRLQNGPNTNNYSDTTTTWKRLRVAGYRKNALWMKGSRMDEGRANAVREGKEGNR